MSKQSTLMINADTNPELMREIQAVQCPRQNPWEQCIDGQIRLPPPQQVTEYEPKESDSFTSKNLPQLIMEEESNMDYNSFERQGQHIRLENAPPDNRERQSNNQDILDGLTIRVGTGPRYNNGPVYISESESQQSAGTDATVKAGYGLSIKDSPAVSNPRELGFPDGDPRRYEQPINSDFDETEETRSKPVRLSDSPSKNKPTTTTTKRPRSTTRRPTTAKTKTTTTKAAVTRRTTQKPVLSNTARPSNPNMYPIRGAKGPNDVGEFRISSADPVPTKSQPRPTPPRAGGSNSNEVESKPSYIEIHGPKTTNDTPKSGYKAYKYKNGCGHVSASVFTLLVSVGLKLALC